MVVVGEEDDMIAASSVVAGDVDAATGVPEILVGLEDVCIAV